MTRIAWLTDIHLDFVPLAATKLLFDRAFAERPAGVVVTGDISESRVLFYHLRLLAAAATCPVYFVLGNHDFYASSIAAVRRQTAALCGELPVLTYLTAAEVVELSPTLGLVGHDGWADARLGDYENSEVMLNDFFLIEELAHLEKLERRRRLEALGDEAAAHVRRWLPVALARYPQVLVATHVPPFREACRYQGRPSDENWLPHFSCRAMGDALLEAAAAAPNTQVAVLCGHTHGGAECRPLVNLCVLTGEAVYQRPRVQQVLEW